MTGCTGNLPLVRRSGRTFSSRSRLSTTAPGERTGARESTSNSGARGRSSRRRRSRRSCKKRASRPGVREKFKATTDSRHTKRIAPNLLERDFTADAPNQVWVTDVTALWTLGGWVYLAAILDLFSRRVVGWACSTSNDTALALEALSAALTSRKPPPGLIHHSDRGSPYGSDAYVEALESRGCVRSMSRERDGGLLLSSLGLLVRLSGLLQIGRASCRGRGEFT